MIRKGFVRDNMKKLGVKIFLAVIITALLFSNFNLNFSISAADYGSEEPVISSAAEYKNMDYEFLKNFPFGESLGINADLTFDTAETLKTSTDIRLKNNTYIKTNGYYSAGDLGGALYLIGAEEEAFGAIPLLNGLYANFIPDRYYGDNGLNWIVLSVKQFGARGDGTEPDQNAINSAFSFADSYGDKDRAIIYLPTGEYKACNRIQANASDINLIGDGDGSVIFTDNDYRKEYAFDEPFFASWNGKNNFFGFFKIEARETDIRKYMRQMCLFYCENMYIYRVNYYIPEEAWSGRYFEDKQYTNLTIYSGDKQITVDECVMYQMSGTYRGANIGIMDFWRAGTEDIKIMNCELHDNARDEQVGIFSLSGDPSSYIRNVDFVGNKVYTYSTPYRDIHGWRTMCFTVAYGDNNVRDINIADNDFIVEADSKFMTFGSVRDCKVHDNRFQIKSSCGNMGYVFDSSCTNDEDVIIYDNEFDLTYLNAPEEGKCLSAGHMIFTGNRVAADSTVYKIADRLGVYEDNEFIFLTPFGSCGSANKFNNSTVTAYAGHSMEYSEIMFMLNEGDYSTNYEYIGNTVIDYEFYNGAKNKKIYDRLSSINGITADTVNFSNNTYLCPNYRYATPDDYIYISWYRSGSDVQNLICEGNDFQGAKGIYGYELEDDKNITREFTSSGEEPSIISIDIEKDGIPITELTTADSTVDLSAVTATVERDNGSVNTEIDWLTNFESIADVENGTVTRNRYGDVTVYAVSKDGSGVYGKAVIHFIENEAADIKIEQDNITMQQGSKHRVMYKVLPENTDQTLEWISENSNIASVSESGVIEALGLGETYVVCRTTDGSNIEKRIKVTVTDISVTQIVLSDSYDYYEAPGEEKQLNVAEYLPENAVNTGIGKWESTNETVAKVDQNGLVNIIGRGSCQIRAYTMGLDRYAAYNIYVKPEKIQNVTVQTTKNGSVIRWDYLSNCDGYNLYRAEGSSEEWTKVAGAIKKDNTVYYETNLKENTEYRYYVTALVAGYDTNARVEYEGIPSDIAEAKTNSTELIISISTKEQNLSVPLGYTEEITAICSPGNADIKELNWQIADTGIAELVSADETAARLKGNKVGFTVLTISATDGGGAKTEVPVGVTPSFKVQTVELSNQDNDVTVKWKGIDEEDEIDGYMISRTNTMVLRPICYIPMDELTAVRDENGESHYTYTDYDLTYELTYRYAVTPYIIHDGLIYTCIRSADRSIAIPEYTRTGSIIAEDKHVINIGEEKEVTAMINSTDTSSGDFTWYSKDENIAVVEKTGSGTAKLIGKKTGITKIVITSDNENDGYISAKVIVLPDKINNAAEKEILYTEVMISWEKVQGATGYNIYRYDPAESGFVQIGSTCGYVYKDMGLKENAEYIYAVSAYIKDGQADYEGDKSDEIKVKTMKYPQSSEDDKEPDIPGSSGENYTPDIFDNNHEDNPAADTADNDSAEISSTAEIAEENQVTVNSSEESQMPVISDDNSTAEEIGFIGQNDTALNSEKNEDTKEAEDIPPKTGGESGIWLISVFAISSAVMGYCFFKKKESDRK